MSESDAGSKLNSSLLEILGGFCGDDLGRSVAFRGHAPVVPDISIRGETPRPAASVIKTALAMAVYQQGFRGKINLSSRVSIQRFPSTRYVSILAAFDPDRELSIREICRLALITSDNPLAVYLQSLVDFDAVNRMLKEIGCGPRCVMAAGFSEGELGSRNRANVLTADAAVRLFSVVKTEPAYADLFLALKNNLRNNRIPALLPEHVSVIHKTGSLDGVANDAGIVQDDKVDFTVAFLTDRQPDPIKTSYDIASCSLELFNCLSGAPRM
jgi:beta-lactamase class A